MLDVVYLVSTAACFAVALVYITACEHLKGRPSVD